jgi:hypothetical protein
MQRMLKEQADGNAFGIAELYAFHGQSDEAMHWLKRAHAQKNLALYCFKRSSRSRISKWIPATGRFRGI